MWRPNADICNRYGLHPRYARLVEVNKMDELVDLLDDALREACDALAQDGACGYWDEPERLDAELKAKALAHAMAKLSAHTDNPKRADLAFHEAYEDASQRYRDI